MGKRNACSLPFSAIPFSPTSQFTDAYTPGAPRTRAACLLFVAWLAAYERMLARLCSHLILAPLSVRPFAAISSRSCGHSISLLPFALR